jgi:7-carboxy-7-deazaguanine synthase
MKSYQVNEIFYSVQGEGIRSGTANVFVRLSGCNMDCQRGHEEENADFDCDTEFVSGVRHTGPDILAEALRLVGKEEIAPAQSVGVIFTGGEPGLQLDQPLVDLFSQAGFLTAIETNGTVDISGLGLDWVTVSPKVAEHALRQLTASEVKYVRHRGQGVPKPRIEAKHYLISPAFRGFDMDPEAVAWCQKLVLENRRWRLSLQQHKWINVR